jgi:tetratricopeptide (TPR) repeat protein
MPLALRNRSRVSTSVGDCESQESPQLESDSRRHSVSFLTAILGLFALTYAFTAGLRTVADMDLGWQMATGRWIVQHHKIPFTDVLSHTARGREWIYPGLSQILLYGVYSLGGYSLLSVLGAAACVGTIALQLRRASAVTALLALLAVPLVAARTAPRAEMFTEVLIAAFLSVLWHYHRSGQGTLWLLPLLMCLWTNLHPGFIAGLGICASYVAMEFGDAAFASHRPAAFKRLRHAALWLLATAGATLLNPWGARIYVALARQGGVLDTHSHWIHEWSPLRITSARLMEVLAWREPDSAIWWLILIGIVAALVAVYMRAFVPALLLGASVYAVIHALRMKAAFASVVVVIGGSILADAIGPGWVQCVLQRVRALRAIRAEAVTFLFLAVAAGFTAIRVFDLVTNRYYLKTPQQFTEFGAGESYWYPEEAAAFVLREQLPGNIFNDYSSGGFVAWALSPGFPDYIDGRAIPFGDELFVHSKELLNQPLDSPAWQLEAESRNLNTVLVSLDHELSGALSELKSYCASRQWRPVYLDTHAAVFVRARPETAGLLSRLQIDCNDLRLDHPPAVTSNRGRAQAFHYHLNAAYILLALGKPEEALQSLNSAGSIFSESAFLHFAKGLALQSVGRWDDAERELYTAHELGSDNAALALAVHYQQLGRYADEARILSRAAERSDRPHLLYLRLGYVQLEMGQPHEALLSFDQAEKESPFVGEAAALGEDFRAQLAEGRRRAREWLARK